MTFEQLSIFVAVAERQHLTKAAIWLGLSPSAVSASLRVLEAQYGIALFHRVGRGIELTATGRAFLRIAKETLAQVQAAERVLKEFGGLARGDIHIQASQTIANYWLPPRLMEFHERHPQIETHLRLGNTASVTAAVRDGEAELGFIEGVVDEPALSSLAVAVDKLVVVVRADAAVASRPSVAPAELLGLAWVMREIGSGTRAVFEAGLRALDLDSSRLDIVMTLPSNEAVLSAVRSSGGATALSHVVVRPFVETGELAILPVALKPRAFTLLRHKERPLSAAARGLADICRCAGNMSAAGA